MHIGLGLKFDQPTILAEGVAEAAVHDGWYYIKYLDACEAVAAQASEPPVSLIDCYTACLADPIVTTCSAWELIDQFELLSPEWPDGRWFIKLEPLRDGVVAKALGPLYLIAARFRLSADDDLYRAAVEVLNTALYLVCASQRPQYEFQSFWLSDYLTEFVAPRAQAALLIEMTVASCSSRLPG